MSPEAQKPSEQIDLKPLLLLGGIFLLSQFAFSNRSKNNAIGRSGNKSEISGVSPEPGETLDVMHTDHTKDQDQDNPKRSLVVTAIEHLIYHRVHRGRAEDIGLTENENEGAIRLTQYRAVRNERKKKWFKAP